MLSIGLLILIHPFAMGVESPPDLKTCLYQSLPGLDGSKAPPNSVLRQILTQVMSLEATYQGAPQIFSRQLREIHYAPPKLYPAKVLTPEDLSPLAFHPTFQDPRGYVYVIPAHGPHTGKVLWSNSPNHATFELDSVYAAGNLQVSPLVTELNGAQYLGFKILMSLQSATFLPKPSAIPKIVLALMQQGIYPIELEIHMLSHFDGSSRLKRFNFFLEN